MRAAADQGTITTRLSWPLVTAAMAYAYALVVGFKYGTLLSDPGVHWHVASGRWIIEHGALPAGDPFSFTAPGAPWVTADWLAELIMTAAFEAGGFDALVVMTAAAFALTTGLLTRFLLRSLDPIYALAFTVLLFFGVAPHLFARPFVLAMPIAVIWVGQLARAADEGRTPGLWLLPLIALWANLHGGFTLGLVIGGAFALEAILAAVGRQERRGHAGRWIGFMVLAALATLVTPHHVNGLLLTLTFMQHKYALQIISEWKSPNFQSQLFYLAWILMVFGGLLGRGIRLPPVRLLVVLGLLYLALRHVRNFENLALFTPLVIAAPLARQLRETAAGVAQAERIDRFMQHLARPMGRRFAVLALAAGVLLTAAVVRTWEAEPTAENRPVAAVAAMQARGIPPGPVFNHLSLGGYLIFSGIPVYIDDRTYIWGDDFLKEYYRTLNLANEADALPRLLDRWNIAWTLLKPGVPAVALLDHLPGWERFYADDMAVVHVRRAPAAKP